MRLIDWIVLISVAAALAAAVIRIRKNKKNNKGCGCSGGCSGCPYSSSCRKEDGGK